VFISMNLSLTACIYKTFGSGLDVSELTPAAEGFDVKEVAIRFIAKRYSVDADSLFYLNGYEDDTTKHVFIGETYVYTFIFRNVTLTEFIFLLRMTFLSPTRCRVMLCSIDRTKLLLSALPW